MFLVIRRIFEEFLKKIFSKRFLHLETVFVEDVNFDAHYERG